MGVPDIGGTADDRGEANEAESTQWVVPPSAAGGSKGDRGRPGRSLAGLVVLSAGALLAMAAVYAGVRLWQDEPPEEAVVVDGEVIERLGLGDNISVIVAYTEPGSGRQRELRQSIDERSTLSEGDQIAVSVIPNRPDTAEVAETDRVVAAILIIMGGVFAFAAVSAIVGLVRTPIVGRGGS